MDPDMFFVMLAMLALIPMAATGAIGLWLKVWRSGISFGMKLLISTLMIGYAIFIPFWIAKGLPGAPWFMYTIFLTGMFFYGLNFSLNVANSRIMQRINLQPSIKIALLTMVLTVGVPYAFIGIGFLIASLDLLGGI